MTTEVDTFVADPSDDLFDGLTKDQLDQVATHYGIEVSKNDKRSKVSLKKSLRAGFVFKGLLDKDTEELTPSRSKKTPSTSPVLSLAPGGSLTTYQQHPELRLQLEHKQVDRDVEMAELKFEM